MCRRWAPLSAQFTETVGEPVMHYVDPMEDPRALRRRSLPERGAPPTRARRGDRYGAAAEAAFGHTFKRMTGLSPGPSARHDAAEAEERRVISMDALE